MRVVEIFFDGGEIGYEGDDSVEVDAFEPFVNADHDTRPSLFGDEHITVAEMVRRVQVHGELVRALGDLLGCATGDDDGEAKAAAAVLAKEKP